MISLKNFEKCHEFDEDVSILIKNDNALRVHFIRSAIAILQIKFYRIKSQLLFGFGKPLVINPQIKISIFLMVD